MKRGCFCILLLLLVSSLSACTQGEQAGSRILAKVNDYNLTLDDFQYHLSAEMKLDKDLKLTHSVKQEFLNAMIRKELLIQEAKKSDLDRKEAFIKAIERYWEATLIRDVMNLKSREIDVRTVVSQEEIESHYRQIKADNPPPLEALSDGIAKTLQEKKKSRALKQWIDGMWKNASIEINEEFLSEG